MGSALDESNRTGYLVAVHLTEGALTLASFFDRTRLIHNNTLQHYEAILDCCDIHILRRSLLYFSATQSTQLMQRRWPARLRQLRLNRISPLHPPAPSTGFLFSRAVPRLTYRNTSRATYPLSTMAAVNGSTANRPVLFLYDTPKGGMLPPWNRLLT